MFCNTSAKQLGTSLIEAVVCLNVQANSFWSEIQAACCTRSCNNPKARNCISEATTGHSVRSLLLENGILLGWKQRPQRFSTCHSTTNESAMGRRLSRDPSGCEPPLWVTPPGFTMEYPRELDRVKRPQRPEMSRLHYGARSCSCDLGFVELLFFLSIISYQPLSFTSSRVFFLIDLKAAIIAVSSALGALRTFLASSTGRAGLTVSPGCPKRDLICLEYHGGTL